MDIVFEWHTNTLGRVQKEKLEDEIKDKITRNIEKITEMEIKAVVVSLHDDATTATSFIKGEIFRNDVPQKVVICNMKIDHGFMIHCKETSWYQPGHNPDFP